MTLEQSFPGLRIASGGALIALADKLFDLTGPASELMVRYNTYVLSRPETK